MNCGKARQELQSYTGTEAPCLSFASNATSVADVWKAHSVLKREKLRNRAKVTVIAELTWRIGGLNGMIAYSVAVAMSRSHSSGEK